MNDRMRAIDRAVTLRAGKAVERVGITGLSTAHNRLMAEMEPGGVRPSQLAERLGVTKAAVGQLIARLEENGLLRRAPDPADGRALLVKPTDKALAAYRVGRAEITAIEAEWRARLGPRNIALLERSLAILEGWAREQSASHA